MSKHFKTEQDLDSYDFNFEVFGAGLLLIIFSLLMKRASEIEKNWSLTI